MRSPLLTACITLAVLAAVPAAASAQATSTRPERAIRHDIPMTDMIQRAMAAGTRDSTGRPGRNYWQLWNDYTIHASLDPATGMVTGHERVVVNNNGPNEMRSIVLRLDQNLFAANVPKARAVTAITDGMVVTSLSVNGQPVALNAGGPSRSRYGRGQPTAPIELAAYNLSQTVATIQLAEPVPAHGSVTIDAEWHFTVPKVVAGSRGDRMGAWGDSLYQVAQWYPRVAMFDDLRQGGWDTDPYLGPSEFYNNFGRFDMTLDLPAGWLVGATGVLQNPDEVLTADAREGMRRAMAADSTVRISGPGQATAPAADGRLAWHFVADTAGDVAWAASNQFVWDGYHAAIPGSGENVPINIMYLPGHEQQFAAAGPTVRHALEFYSRLWIPYAFPTMTMVDGPELGMEYPMFIMSSVGAADHEVGHEWWPMILGTNETWYGFMDEGFNQYMNILSRADRQGESPNLDGQGQRYGQISGDEREAPLMWDANYGGPMYSFQAYSKAPLMLSMLGGIVGDTAVWQAMSDYAEAWRFRHPAPWDFAFFMSNALGRDLGWFWYSWLFTTDAVDGSIQGMSAMSGPTTVTVHQAGQMPSPVVLNVHFAPKGPALRPVPGAVMVDDSTAMISYPVEVWFNGSKSFKATFDFGPRAIERVVLDPHCRFPDHDVLDNTWPRQPPPAAPTGGGGRFGGAPCQG
jgi:hypothetical protein